MTVCKSAADNYDACKWLAGILWERCIGVERWGWVRVLSVVWGGWGRIVERGCHTQLMNDALVQQYKWNWVSWSCFCLRKTLAAKKWNTKYQLKCLLYRWRVSWDLFDNTVSINITNMLARFLRNDLYGSIILLFILCCNTFFLLL